VNNSHTRGKATKTSLVRVAPQHTGAIRDDKYLTMAFVLSNTAEAFPLVFAVVMLCVAVFFSVWVVASNTFRSAPKEEEEVVRPQLARKSSWVANSIHTLLTSGRWVANSAERLEVFVSRSRSASLSESIKDCSSLQSSGSGVEIPYDERGEMRKRAVQELQLTAARAESEQKAMTSTKNENIAVGVPEPSALLSWSHVTCSYPISKSSDEHFTSLRNSFGEMRATELTAIMGGSGSGKSTLLDILSGRKTLGDIEGKLSVLGEVLDDIGAQAKDEGGALRSVAAYVPQREAFFPTQTAEEAVAFVANLKLGKDPRGDDVRWSRIQSVLREVGLR
jgi:ABC-type multidrug transport system fused ATPase/permease subunit